MEKVSVKLVMFKQKTMHEEGEYCGYCPALGAFHVMTYSSEVPVNIADKGSGTKAETLGTMSYMPPIMGQMLAGKVIRRLVGLEETPLAPRIGNPADENQPPTES